MEEISQGLVAFIFHNQRRRQIHLNAECQSFRILFDTEVSIILLRARDRFYIGARIFQIGVIS